MFCYKTTLQVVAIVIGLPGLVSAEFQTFTDEASFLAAVGALEAGGAVEAVADVLPAPQLDASSESYSPGPYSGPTVSFTTTADNKFLAIGGEFVNRTSGLLVATLDGQFLAAFESYIDQPGFFGVVAWDGFLDFTVESANVNDPSPTVWEADKFTFAYMDSVAPEPASFALFGIGALTLLGGYGRNRRKNLRSTT